MWLIRLHNLDYNLRKSLKALQTERAALSVEAALVMTIGFAGLLLNPHEFKHEDYDNYIESLEYLIPFFYLLSSGAALLSVSTGSIEYIICEFRKYKYIISYIIINLT